MIKLAEDIDGYDGRKVLIDTSWRRVLIEIAANQQIDVAVVDATTARGFDESQTDKDVEKLGINWLGEQIRQEDFEIDQTDLNNRKYLIFWNAYTDESAVVAYKFTQLPEKKI